MSYNVRSLTLWFINIIIYVNKHLQNQVTATADPVVKQKLLVIK